MDVEKRCYLCGKTWTAENYPDPPYWGVVYDWCGCCKKEMLRSFESQLRALPRLRLAISNENTNE